MIDYYSERFYVRVNDKNKSKLSIISFLNGERRGFIILIHIMALNFNIVITVFKTCRRKVSILNIIYVLPARKHVFTLQLRVA